MVRVLGEFKTTEAVPVLIPTLGDANPDVRQAAFRALGGFEPSVVAPALVTALGDKNARVRQSAARLLEQMPIPEETSISFVALIDTDKTVRQATLRALGGRDKMLSQGMPGLEYAQGRGSPPSRRGVSNVD